MSRHICDIQKTLPPVLALLSLLVVAQGCQKSSSNTSAGVLRKGAAISEVTLIPALPTRRDTLTCKATSSEVTGSSNVIKIVYKWYRNGVVLAEKTAGTLDLFTYTRGDEFRCEVKNGADGSVAPLLQSGVVTLQNTLPDAPTKAILTASAANKTGSFTCAYSGGQDPDGDEVTAKYLWKVGTTALTNETNAVLSGNHVSVVKGKTLSCAVALADTKGIGSYTESNGIVIENTPITGPVTCSGAAPQAIGHSGGTYPELTCSGAIDADGASDMAYQLTTVSGTCPSLPATGVLVAGTYGDPGSCTYTVRACDDKTCTAASPVYTLASYSLSLALGSPSLSSDCNLSFAGVASSSSNLSNLVYSASAGLVNAVGAATGISVALSGSTHDAGTYQAIWSVLQGDIGSILGSTKITASSNSVSFALSKVAASSAALKIRAPASSLIGNTQTGRQQIPSGSGACVSPGSGAYAAITTGTQSTCALANTGAVKCWGSNTQGQLGNGNWTSQNSPVAVVGLDSGVVALSAGSSHVCALTGSGTLKCWGSNSQGQLGNGTTTSSAIPVAGSDLNSGVVAVAAGGYHTCALTSSGGAKCWGNNSFGQLGDGSTFYNAVPGNVLGLESGFTAVVAGGFHSCALNASGGVKCWGQNSNSQLGDGSTITTGIPTDVTGLSSGIRAITTGFYHTCGLTNAGTADS